MKYIIVGYDKNYGIGANNDLLWHRDLPADLAQFKQLTTGQAVIMGWNTYLSIGRPLPNRQNIVISHNPDNIDGFTVVSNLEEAFLVVNPALDAYVIGGCKIYAQALGVVSAIYATEVDAVFDNATVFFPAIDKKIWHETSRQNHPADDKNKYPYSFVTYKKL